jgi:hypothetical protein
MQIMTSVIWHKDLVYPETPGCLRVDELLPKPGQQRTVWLSKDLASQEATLHLLWVPPYSESNGWDHEPSEIALSQIINCRVGAATRADSAAPEQRSATGLGQHLVERDIVILDRIPLLEACERAFELRPSGPVDQAMARAAYTHWLNAHWWGAADVCGFTYLSAVSGETQLQAILRRRDDQTVICYQELDVDGWSQCSIDCWGLDDRQSQTFNKYLGSAVALLDHARPYLGWEQIAGRSYTASGRWQREFAGSPAPSSPSHLTDLINRIFLTESFRKSQGTAGAEYCASSDPKVQVTSQDLRLTGTTKRSMTWQASIRVHFNVYSTR